MWQESKGKGEEQKKGSLPLSNFPPFLPPPPLVPATHTNGEGPPRFMVGTRGEGEKRKEPRIRVERKDQTLPLSHFSPPPPSSPPPLLVPATHADGKEPPKFMAGAGWEGEGEKGKEEKKDRNKCSLPLSYLLWVEGPITCWLIHESERGL